MRVTSNILNAAIETLETRKSRWHSLGSQVEVCVENVNYTHNSNVLYPCFYNLAKSMYKFTMILDLLILKGISY